MNKIFKRTTGIAAAILLTLATSMVAFTGTTSAIPYTPGATGTDHPSFNNFTGVPGYGDEHDFVTGRVSGSSAGFTDPVNDVCTSGTQYSVRVYVHNNANQTLNNNGSGPGVAHNTKVKVSVPDTTSGNIRGTISASNASSVSDNLTIRCSNGKTMTMSYVAGSAIQQKMNGSTQQLSDSIVTSGAPIGTQSPNGDMWGCFDQRVLVFLKVQIKETPPPPPPSAATSCDLFRIVSNSDRKITVSQFKYTAQNTNFKNAVVNWGDNASDTITDSSKVVGSMHQYANDGTYVIRTTVNFENGDSKTSANCVQQVTFSPSQPPEIVVPPTTTTTTTTPSSGVTELANTGAGSVAGMFIAAVAAGVIGFRTYIGRRLGQQ